MHKKTCFPLFFAIRKVLCVCVCVYQRAFCKQQFMQRTHMVFQTCAPDRSILRFLPSKRKFGHGFWGGQYAVFLVRAELGCACVPMGGSSIPHCAFVIILFGRLPQGNKSIGRNQIGTRR